ncbi:MAG: copper homeostasis protein CutC, partial [Candidatus Faecousia sp.]|nr:copper homeostasis protein CutC [Candidatus Faecousia sp.]
VIGALTRDGDLDTAHLTQLMKAAGNMEVTLHRAFDMARDLKTALEQAIDLGFTTILTSGGKASAPRGSGVLAELNDQAAGRIRLMAGAGVNVGNIPALYAQTGITAYHGSCRTGSVPSAMVYRNPEVNMGLPGFSEYEIMRTDPKEVARCVRVVHNLK